MNIDTPFENPHPKIIWVVAALLAVTFAPTVLWLFERWTMSVWQNGHGILICAVVAYLVWEELKKQKEIEISSSSLGFIILIPALFLHMLDTGINSQLLSAIALFLALPGLSFLFLGESRSKAIVFPLLMMLFTLPIPLAFTEAIHMGLRYIATDSVGWILIKLGVSSYTIGTTIEIPNGVLQVADACSGFSTLYATITVAILTAYFCTHTIRRIVVLCIAIPLAIGVNIIRVLALTLLVNSMGLDVLATSAHEISGLLTFAVALPVIFWLGQSDAYE